jgi:hypothetical protein
LLAIIVVVVVVVVVVSSLLPYFEKTKVGLCNLYAVCVYPLLPTFEWLNKSL